MGFPYKAVSALVTLLGDMPYGTTKVVAFNMWRQAIPRADPAQQILLIAGGHRPETEREPLDWVRFWMNGTEDDDFMKVLHEPYEISADPLSGNLIARLDARHCPRCHGREFYRRFPELDFSDPGSLVSPADVIKVERVTCTHLKQDDDTLKRRWP